MTAERGSGDQVEQLLRILRRYADSPIGQSLSASFSELANQGQAGLVAFEPGSWERCSEAVLVAVHQQLSLIVLDLMLEIGAERLEARRWLENIDPGDFG